MSKKLAIAFGLLLLLPVAAQASIADVFQQLDHGTVDDKNFVRTLIVGIEDGFRQTNGIRVLSYLGRRLAIAANHHLFC